MKIVVKEQQLVMGIYGFSLFILTTTVLERMPVSLFFTLTKLKYIYFLVMLFCCLADGVIVISKRLMVAVGLLILHTMIYGLLPGYELGDQGRVHFEQLLTFYGMITVTCVYVYQKNCFLEFLKATYLAISAVVVLAFFLYPGDIVNPIYYVNVFSDTARFRADFGFGDINYCGNYCLYTLVCALFWSWEMKQRQKKISSLMRGYMCLASTVGAIMLFSTASRSAIISLALFTGIFWLLQHGALIYQYRKQILLAISTLVIAIMIIGTSTGLFYQIWISSNREGNFSINYPLFLQYGRVMTGMGYLDNSAFLNKEYGLETTAMDIYYLYIFFTTGLTGMLIIGSQQLYLLYHLIRYPRIKGRNMALSLFLMMLFYAIWQVNYMNYRYYTSMFHMGVLFLFMMEIGRGRDDWTLVFKRG